MRMKKSKHITKKEFAFLPLALQELYKWDESKKMYIKITGYICACGGLQQLNETCNCCGRTVEFF